MAHLPAPRCRLSRARWRSVSECTRAFVGAIALRVVTKCASIPGVFQHRPTAVKGCYRIVLRYLKRRCVEYEKTRIGYIQVKIGIRV